ncbi:MAG: carboxypeptidase-like regulatory domain-containing protein [Acidobacteriaceae bacterium]
MKVDTAKLVLRLMAVVLSLLLPCLLRAQTTAMLSGTVTGPAHKAESNARISARNLQTGKSTETQTDSFGRYSLPNLEPGDYEVTVSAEGLASRSARVTLTTDKPNALNINLNSGPVEQAPEKQPPDAPQANLPGGPQDTTTTPSLEDLGFTPQQTKANAQMQALLEKRTHMLKVHQTLGLITAIPMAASLITGPQAKAKGKKGEVITEPTQANLDFHIALGSLTTGLYWTTAYYSIFAPKVPEVKSKGAIRIHRALEWVHGPGMILTPALGIAAYKQENAGEKVHGIASQHGAAAYVTAVAYGAAIVSVSWPIHWKFWEQP